MFCALLRMLPKHPFRCLSQGSRPDPLCPKSMDHPGPITFSYLAHWSYSMVNKAAAPHRISHPWGVSIGGLYTSQQQRCAPACKAQSLRHFDLKNPSKSWNLCRITRTHGFRLVNEAIFEGSLAKAKERKNYIVKTVLSDNLVLNQF